MNDFEDDNVIIDWIIQHPSTVSEARGNRDIGNWQYNLKNWSSAPRVPGVRYVGSSRSLAYRYVQPETDVSKDFLLFLEDSSLINRLVPGPTPDVTMSEFVPPGDDDLWKHIQGFGENQIGWRQSLEVPLTEMINDLGHLEDERPIITDWFKPDMLAKIKVPGATSPGIRWKKLGYRSKREAIVQASIEARRIMGRMIECGERYEAPPCAVAGRGKRVLMDRPDDPDRKEGRLIVMPDLVRHLLGMMAVQPYMANQKRFAKHNGGIMLGMGPFNEGYQRIAEWAADADAYMFIDFKKFDQRVPRQVLRAAMKHVTRGFQKDRGTGAYWASEFRHLVDTKIAMPDGSVYQKQMGVASGDPWTSIIGSYANWIMINAALKSLGIKTHKTWTFGDDSLIALYGSHGDLDTLKDRVSEKLSELFGMKVSKEKSYVSRHLVGISEEPEERQTGSFLSMYFLQTSAGIMPTRPLQDLYELFLKPERNRGTVEWEVVRTSMAYLIFYWNDNARIILEDYWQYLHTRYKIPVLTGTADDLRLLREMDIPFHLFKREWLNRLPSDFEVINMYKYGHSRFFSPTMWGITYHNTLVDFGHNSLE